MTHPFRHLLIVFALGVSACCTSHADVTVSFIAPERYADAGLTSADKRPVLREIEVHLQRLGARYLRDDEVLAIDILGIDLAGREQVLTRHPEVRVLRGRADWPSFQLRFKLQRNGMVIQAGEEYLSDPFYLEKISTYSSSDRFPYEKRMLDEWFTARIVPLLAGSPSP